MPISIEPRFPLGSSPLSTWQESYPNAATSSTHPLGHFPTTITAPSKTTSLSSQSISPSCSPSLSQTPPDSTDSPMTNSPSSSPTTLPTNSAIPSPARTSNSPSESSSNDSPPSSPDIQISAFTSSFPFHPIQPPARTHPMVTQSENQIFKPKQLYLAESPCSEVEPTCVSQAVKDHQWRLKRGKDGQVERYKVMLVAKGFHQQPRTNYTQTFSPVIKPTTIRAILSIAVSRGWKIHQLDINNAFLHGKVDEQLFMQQPAAFIDPNLPHHVCRLRKFLYGLKQAPRMWFRELKQFLLAHGLTNSSNATAIDRLITAMSSKFPMKNLGTQLGGFGLRFTGGGFWGLVGGFWGLGGSWFGIVWILNLLHELGIPPSTPPVLYCDNIGAAYLSSNLVMHSRMKHIAIDLHFVRDLVDHKFLRVSHISSKDQLANGLTKPLSSTRFTYLRSKIGIADSSSILRGRVKEKI
ncbi:hypothetical protein SLEP1_g40194 [Rubroshorea leprosula]|uniref:Reverse transcriptase Ty1/copia-type domain-containing protein n=1 Tax=Rubroshorea leprosula TaxID=152421 RepID=A0AAV5L3I4_9ROSI|nr:hypothetical protein SLEP1_g40194 [Rubroshorea leprosula]